MNSSDWNSKGQLLHPEPESRVQRHPVALGEAQALISRNALDNGFRKSTPPSNGCSLLSVLLRLVMPT